MSRKSFPMVVGGGPDGAMVANIGRYHREAIGTAFQMLGGVEALVDWAEANKTDFYTKLYPRIIPKEVEVGSSQGVEDLLRQLDSQMLNITPKEADDAT